MGCVFCGATDRKMSNEHIWPTWIRELLPESVANEVVTLHFTDSHLGHVRSFRQPLFQLTVKDVCEPCNTGWMISYETAVQPVITGMLQGHGRALHEGQARIAAWATMKALLVQRTFPRRELVPDEHYGEVYATREARRPPSLTRVYTAKAGWSKGVASPGFFRLNGIGRADAVAAGSDAIHGYLATFSVLDLVVQVFRLHEPTDADFVHPSEVASSVSRIWPAGLARRAAAHRQGDRGLQRPAGLSFPRPLTEP